MVKFFRKIRQKLLSENRFSKYLLYAIGEIILVVIGILIAIQINNWNNSRINTDKLIASYEQILQSLEVDLVNLSSNIDEQGKAFQAGTKAWQHLKEKRDWPGLYQLIQEADNLSIYTPQSAAFEAIKLNGVELIENAILKNQLFRVYGEFTQNYKRREEIIENMRNSYFNPWYAKNLDRKDQNSPYIPRNYEQILNDNELVGNLLVIAGRQNSLKWYAKHLTEQIQLLKDEIKEEISRLKKGKKLPDSKRTIILSEEGAIFKDGKLRLGISMGMATSGGEIGWVKTTDDIICMSYPANQQWGVCYFYLPGLSEDYSIYQKLFIELKGLNGDEVVEIAIKDKDDPHDGSEDRYLLELTDEWKLYEIDITENFGTANLTELRDIAQFVFSSLPQNICVRQIYYK